MTLRVTSQKLPWRRMTKVICLQTPTVFWLGEGTNLPGVEGTLG